MNDLPVEAFAEGIALLATGLFFGAALCISLVEHPARVEAGVDVALREFAPSYRRAARMQATAAIIGSLSAASVAVLERSFLWASSAVLLFSVVALTLVVIAPVTRRLRDAGLRPGDLEATRLLARWARLHWARTASSALAFVLQIVAAEL